MTAVQMGIDARLANEQKERERAELEAEQARLREEERLRKIKKKASDRFLASRRHYPCEFNCLKKKAFRWPSEQSVAKCESKSQIMQKPSILRGRRVKIDSRDEYHGVIAQKRQEKFESALKHHRWTSFFRIPTAVNSNILIPNTLS